MENILITDDSGRVLVNKDALLLNNIYTDISYRTSKQRKRFTEILFGDKKYVLLKSLPEQTRKLTVKKLQKINMEYTGLLLASEGLGLDSVDTAIEFTADTLETNELFIRSAVEDYINTHYVEYINSYMNFALFSQSAKGYAKQCALVEWIYDYVRKIKTCEASAKRLKLLASSFRANLLTVLRGIELEIKIPLSDARFNVWLDDIIVKMDKGARPEDIIKVKRMGNLNSGKITDEQFRLVYGWHINGSNMSISTLYRKWITLGLEKGWWIDKKTGSFNPPTEGRLYQMLSPFKNPSTLKKTDAVNYHLKMIPSVSRNLPEKKNEVWVIDGTAHNENVAVSGKVRQHVYVIKLMDVATCRLVGACPLIGVKEPFYAVRETILMGIRETGYKPAIIHCDRGPAWRELETWCKDNDIRLYLSMAGNARAKPIESLFNMFDNDITRFLNGYSGGNRTALSVNSRSSERRETEGKRNARSASLAMEWIKTEGMKAWNERIIEQLEGKPCGKTPYELWDEKESYTPSLGYTQLCVLCGVRHERKLTINGLDITHNGKDYTYFPPIETSEERAAAAGIFNSIPMDAKTANVLSIYIPKAGSPAPVYDHSGKFIGIWKLKPRVDYIDKSGNLDKFMALAYRIKEQAVAINAEAENEISRHPDCERIEALGHEMLTGKRREYAGRYDKIEFLKDEVSFKSGESEPAVTGKMEYREIVDTDTGEIYRIPINETV